MATLCFDRPSGSTHSANNLAGTGPSICNNCNTYFFARGGRDLTFYDLYALKPRSTFKTQEEIQFT